MRKGKEKKKIGFLKFVILVLGIVAVEIAGSLAAYAAEVPASFTAESIRNAGVEDANFAAAIYSSIAQKIEDDVYAVEEGWTVEEILENYSDENLDGDLATIEGTKANIRSIKGITLLKNASEIYLEKNQIHDLSPLEWDGSAEGKIFFNTTCVRMGNGNYHNIIPEKLIGTQNGNYTVDRVMTFDPAELNYVYDGSPKSVKLDFGLQLHGAEGGIFNPEKSAEDTENSAGASWTEYADYLTRYTGTTITFPGNDGNLVLSVNANEDTVHDYPATIYYYSDPTVDAKLNMEWKYAFRPVFYRTVTEHVTAESTGSIRLTKTGPDGETLAGAVYELYRIGVDSTRERYPDDSTTYPTDTDGELLITGIPAGNYELQEISAPEGYEINEEPVAAQVTSAAVDGSAAIQGGETSITILENHAAFTPVWDWIETQNASGKKVVSHILERTAGSETTVTAADYSADCFIKNGGTEITALKGEAAGIPSSEVKVTVGDQLLGTYGSEEEARTALNTMINGSAFGADQGNIVIDTVLTVNDTDNVTEVSQVDEKEKPEETTPAATEPTPEETTPAATEPAPEEPKTVTIENPEKITVHKTWSDDVHPLKAFFRLVLKLRDGTLRLIGKIKEVSEETGWTAVWEVKEIQTYIEGTASASDAEIASGSDASPSDASASDADKSGLTLTGSSIYDEDGMLLDSQIEDDISRDFYIEEVQIPDAWVPQYGEAETAESGEIVFEVENKKVPEEPEEPEEPDQPDTPPVAKGDGGHSSGGSSGGSTSGGGTPSTGVASSVKTETPAEEETVRNKVKKQQPDLPWGRIYGKNLPKMGEEATIQDPMIICSMLWAVGVLLIVMSRWLRVGRKTEKKEER